MAEMLAEALVSLEAAFNEDNAGGGQMTNISNRIICPGDDPDADVREDQPTLCIWSGSANSDRYPAKLISSADASQAQIHALLPGGAMVSPWTEDQAGSLGWLDEASAEGMDLVESLRSIAAADQSKDFWDLLKACYKVTGAFREMRYCLYRQNSQRSHIETGERARRHWRYSDLEEMARCCAPAVRDFAPDVMFSFDARGGQWAITLSQLAGIQPAIHVGFRIKLGGLRRRDENNQQSSIWDVCSVINSDRWELYLPPVVSQLNRSMRILFVDDYSKSGETCRLWRNHMMTVLGFEQANLRTLTLFTTKDTDLSTLPGHIFGWQSDARVNSLVYMHQR